MIHKYLRRILPEREIYIEENLNPIVAKKNSKECNTNFVP
jgi:hypothetical protein